jgi:predicted metal-binding protein
MSVTTYPLTKHSVSVEWRAQLHCHKSLEIYKDEVKFGCPIISAVKGVLEILSEYALDCITCMKHTLRDLTNGSLYEIGDF